LHGAPSGVVVRRLPRLRCAGFGRGNVRDLIGPVQEFARNADGSIAVLSRHNNHVWGLHVAAGGTLRLNEGSDYEMAYALLGEAVTNKGSPEHLAKCLVTHIESISTGLDAGKLKAVLRALRSDRITFGRHQILRPFLQQLEALYADPGVAIFCATAKVIVETPPDWLTIRMPASMRLIALSRPGPEDDPVVCLDAVIARIKAGARRHLRMVSTVHKAKGLEYDHVLIGNVSASHFGDDELSRRIAYVALSRARRSITMLVPADQPSPLLG
jgi:hypothetical protein